MFLTVHVTTGAWIGTVMPNVPAAFFVGVVSHFLLDRVPHYDPPIAPGTAKDGVLKNPIFQRFLAIAAIDVALALVMTAGLVRQLPAGSTRAIVAGAVGGMFPDLLFGLYRLTNHPWLAAFNRLHAAIHFDPKKIPVTFLTGMATQLATFVFMLIVLFQ